MEGLIHICNQNYLVMKIKLILCVISLVVSITLLNSVNPVYAEAGKAVMVLSILGFYATARLKEVVEEEEHFEKTIEKQMPSIKKKSVSNKRVA
jgi:hypothetical protein